MDMHLFRFVPKQEQKIKITLDKTVKKVYHKYVCVHRAKRWEKAGTEGSHSVWIDLF